ncbi:MAG: hypothetical protein QM657_02265 [Lacrimispora sp.]|uniref:hypothetical protein n=1 Tax=Lacrimispora sp. TaxID=2719234 RepID=UPI0039E27A5D
MKEKRRTIAAIGLITVLLLALGAAGSAKNEKAALKRESQEAASSLPAKKEAVTETSEEALTEISLTPEEKELLDQLTEQMERGDLEAAARTLNGYQIPWKEFPYMYDKTAMKAEVSDGKGLVFIKASTVFYGDFADGSPQGNCTALQVLELEEGKRYDYSFGTWDQGKMTGEGESGYNYYDGVTEDVTKTNIKKGTFQKDLMEGAVTYTSINAAGEETTWQFDVQGGVIVPDDKWIKETDSSGAVVYRLMAEGAEVHAYTLSESAMGESRWKNLIVYENWKAGGF